MKIMLAYYNDLTVLLSTIYRALELEIDYIGKPKRKTIELATKFSPESWCFDTKLLLGQAIEGIARGDDVITMPGAWGGRNENCLLGYLTKGIMQRRLEKITRKKVQIWFFNANPAEIILSGYTAAYKNLSQPRQYSRITFFRSRLMKALILGTQKMKLVAGLKDKFLESSNVIDKQELFSIFEGFVEKMIFEADTLESAKVIHARAVRAMEGLERRKLQKRMTIGIVGDYAHTLFSLHPFFDIERFFLSEGISIRQPLSFFNYYNFRSDIYRKQNRRKAREILPQSVSGSDTITVFSSLSMKDSVDGIIHIRTFGCMPEEVANEVLLSHNFPPILSLSYDAHTTEESLRVRIEAFIDMLQQRKRAKEANA
jgi:predicted nucleotide-binding protein (sugar kinase/HSP70/actin superfamily)